MEDRDASLLVVAVIARYDGQSVMQGSRGNDEVWLRECVPDLSAVFDQKTPFEHDVLCDGEDALREHRPHFVGEPVVELGASGYAGDGLDAEPDFGKGDGADKEVLERLFGDEGDHLAFRL